MLNGTVGIDGLSINGLSGFASPLATSGAPSTGILASLDGTTSGVDFDTLADPSTGLFLFAEVDFVADAIGTVNLAPDGFLIDSGVLGSFTGSSATINVVPEPATGSGVALVLFVSAR